LLVDDAHGVGVVGDEGRGSCAAQAVRPELADHADAVGVIHQQQCPGGLRRGVNGRQRRAVAIRRRPPGHCCWWMTPTASAWSATKDAGAAPRRRCAGALSPSMLKMPSVTANCSPASGLASSCARCCGSLPGHCCWWMTPTASAWSATKDAGAAPRRRCALSCWWHRGAIDQMTGKLQQIIGHCFVAQHRRAADAEGLAEGLLVDDAHGVGVVGDEGRGSCAAQAVRPELLVVT
jgi:hypothetical protein